MLQAAPVPAARPDTGQRDTTGMRVDEDSIRLARWKEARRIPLTPELEASAYRDPLARELVQGARRARLQQDSTLVAYDETTHERITLKAGIGSVGRDKLFLRTETAARVRWKRGRGAIVDVVGARTAIPMIKPGVRVIMDMLHVVAIPYYPGRESLLPVTGSTIVESSNSDPELINPVEAGAESYYRFESGDSVSFLLPDGTRGRLREVRVEARRPRSDLLVGSLWFETRSHRLVRAVYRPSLPLNVEEFVKATEKDGLEDVPTLVKPMIFPISYEVTALVVEYELHEQRWWLPRVETMLGRLRIGFTRVPFSREESYRYASVNARDSLAPIFASESDSLKYTRHDSTHRMRERAMHDAKTDSTAAARERRRSEREHTDDDEFGSLHCTPGDTISERSVHGGGALPMLVRIPCDTASLIHSKEFSPSIYDAGDELFATKDREELQKSLSLGLQPGWAPQRPTIHYGVDRGMVRYNRVEALSAGVLLESTLGRGYTANGSVRIGIADWQPNVEAHLTRGNGERSYSLGAYRRLNSANDWGDPLSLGSSISALLWAHDEGFYFRSGGAELLTNTSSGDGFTWRLFAERQDDAEKHTNVSLWHALGGAGFNANIRAQNATQLGLGARYSAAFGLDPKALRTTLDLRGEGATGTFDYARASAEATATRGLGRNFDAALTASLGSSVGTVPVQRFWFLGGVATIRGQEPGTQAGDSYWLGHAELGRTFNAVRPTIFYDLGWAGARSGFAGSGRPISGAGFGVAVLDGLVRFDLAHGIHPDHALRADLYTSAKF